MPNDPVILFAGSGEFGLPTLKALAAEYRVALVVSQPDRPAGRGRKLTPTPISSHAETAGMALVKTDNINALPLPPADVMVVVAFGQKIAPHVTDHAKHGAINLHASLLPRHRGAAPIHHAVLAGDTTTGNSIIRLAAKMDAGAVLAQSSRPIGDSQTTGELHDLLAADGAGLVLAVVGDLLAGRAVETPQDHSLATLAPKLSRESAMLDFSLPAVRVARHINAMSPWPGCRVQLLSPDGGEIVVATLLRATPSSAPARAPPGVIRPDGSVACGTGAIHILQLQPAGRPAMSLDSFRNGHPWSPGHRIAAEAK